MLTLTVHGPAVDVAKLTATWDSQPPKRSIIPKEANVIKAEKHLMQFWVHVEDAHTQ